MASYIFLNLKRFDVSPESGGVNRLAPMASWGAHIARSLDAGLRARSPGSDSVFVAFLPEAHILPAASVLAADSPLRLGCQAVHREDCRPGGNFGAFTSLRTARAARELGCEWTIIGHSEERRALTEVLLRAGVDGLRAAETVDGILREEAERALEAGLRILYCIGEKAEELPSRSEVLKRQVERGLGGLEGPGLVLAYEPVWAIGPGKTPPSPAEIAEISEGIKRLASLPLVYGGGLKKDNAEAIGAIPALDGGLIALTRFGEGLGFYPEEYLEIVEAQARGAMRTRGAREVSGARGARNTAQTGGKA